MSAANPPTQNIVRSTGGALATRSATLVARGLRDLARQSNWKRFNFLTGKASKVSVSSRGLVCAISAEPRTAPPRVVIYDLHNPQSQLALAVPGETPALAKHLPAAFAWSLTGRHLAGVWSAWEPAIHLFDLDEKEFTGAFAKFQQPPAHLAWSPDSGYIAAATSGGKHASLRIWPSGTRGERVQDAPLAEMKIPDGLERQTYEAEFGEEGAFHGYGATAFSPYSRTVASVIEIQGDWADDAILLADNPTLQHAKIFQAQGHVSDLTWLPNGDALIFCASAQTYRLDASTLEADTLPFGAELCAAHPTLPLLACYTSWRNDAAKGRLFIADLKTGACYDEHDADAVVELRWSEDGARAYAAARDGNAYIYESEIF